MRVAGLNMSGVLSLSLFGRPVGDGNNGTGQSQHLPALAHALLRFIRDARVKNNVRHC